jgi:bacterial/archaeal transporter family-2 protein
MAKELIIIFVAALAGAALPLQAVINARLSPILGAPLWASFLSFTVGAIVLFAIAMSGVIVGWIPVPTFSNVLRAPWWIWAGGFLGATYVTIALIMASKLGAGTLVAVIVSGQLMAALLIDHFGAFGLPLRPVTPLRLIGVFFLITGVLFIRGTK